MVRFVAQINSVDGTPLSLRPDSNGPFGWYPPLFKASYSLHPNSQAQSSTTPPSSCGSSGAPNRKPINSGTEGTKVTRHASILVRTPGPLSSRCCSMLHLERIAPRRYSNLCCAAYGLVSFDSIPLCDQTNGLTVPEVSTVQYCASMFSTQFTRGSSIVIAWVSQHTLTLVSSTRPRPVRWT